MTNQKKNPIKIRHCIPALLLALTLVGAVRFWYDSVKLPENTRISASGTTPSSR